MTITAEMLGRHLVETVTPDVGGYLIDCTCGAEVRVSQSELDGVEVDSTTGALQAVFITHLFAAIEADATPTPRILSGDPDDIEAALEALPVGSVVRSSDEAIRDREARIWVREDAPDDAAWSGTGRAARPAGYLARYCAPLTVIA